MIILKNIGIIITVLVVIIAIVILNVRLGLYLTDELQKEMFED